MTGAAGAAAARAAGVGLEADFRAGAFLRTVAFFFAGFFGWGSVAAVALEVSSLHQPLPAEWPGFLQI